MPRIPADKPPGPMYVLRALASGQPVSGATLARELGVTRAAVWKHIAALREQGLPIQAQAGAGYSLPWPTELLEPAGIGRRLGSGSVADFEIHWLLDSTQLEIARRQAQLPDLFVTLAEGQSAGRGRRGRAWLAPPGLNLCLSCLKRFEGGFAGLEGLSLAVGVCVAQALEMAGIESLRLKWPNDVVVNGAKLAGILVELSGEYDGPCHAVVGVGINVRLPDEVRKELGQSAVDLADLLGGATPDRNVLAADLIMRLRDGLRRFETDGFPAFKQEFARRDDLRGKTLELHAPDRTVRGIGAGVDFRGALLVSTGTGTEPVRSARVSVLAG